MVLNGMQNPYQKKKNKLLCIKKSKIIYVEVVIPAC